MTKRLNEFAARTIVAPSDEDWIVRFTLGAAEVVAMRVSPSSITAEKAVQRARIALGSRAAQISSVDVVRFVDTRRVII